MAEVIHLPTAQTPRERQEASAMAQVNLARQRDVEALRELTNDWLFEGCGEVGRRKLLAQYRLLAAAA